MSGRYELEFLPEMSRTLTEAAGMSLPSTVRRALARSAIGLAGEAIRQEAFEQAARLAEAAQALAVKAKEGALARQAVAVAESLPWCREQQKRFLRASEILAETPAHPAANLSAGKYLCFVKQNWDKGLPLLAQGNDDTLKALAQAEQAQLSPSAVEMVKLGDQWHAAAGQVEDMLRPGARHRAAYWYQQALPLLTGFTQNRVSRQIQDLQDPDAGRE
jgi:hypothetical protein